MTGTTQAKLTTPEVPVSWGELVDKITILEIKSARLTSDTQRANVGKELTLLAARAAPLLAAVPAVADLKRQLVSVNETLWEIEDRIRIAEAQRCFDQHFIDLARSVYITNDKRAELKREINHLSASELVEEKSYQAY